MVESKEDLKGRMVIIIDRMQMKDMIELAHMRKTPMEVVQLWFLIFTVLGEAENMPAFEYAPHYW